MTPTADQVALAIIEASRVTGANPAEVARGELGKPNENHLKISRARVYALVTLVELGCPRKLAGRLVGIKHEGSQDAYYGTVNARLQKGELRWFDRAIVEEIKAKLQRNVEVSAYVAPPPYRPPPGTVQKMLAGEPPKGQLEATGYRPPNGTIRKVIEDDDDDGPVLGKNRFGLERQRQFAPNESKTTLRDMLRQAVENTVRAQVKVSDG
jgi:hypothetical protein